MAGTTHPTLRTIIALFVVASTFTGVHAATNNTSDPANDPNNPLGYIPSNAATGIVFGIITTIFITQSVFLWKQGGKYMLPMLVGEIAYGLGFLLRFGLHSNPDSKGIFIGEYLLIVLAPCSFIAALYALLGRTAGLLQSPQYLLIRPTRITTIFVTSDVVTFLIQALGGSITVGNNPSKIKLGSNIFLVGLGLQLASFLFFVVVLLRFLLSVKKYEPEIWRKDSQQSFFNDWRALASALIISCAGIIIRTCYRIGEGIQHNQGRLSKVEIYFYLLDTLPLLIVIGSYVPFWPGRFIDQRRKGLQSIPLESQTSVI